MMDALKVLGIILPGELIIHVVFYTVSKLIRKTNRDKITRASIIKGFIERTFVVVILLTSNASALTLLGALKIATRIKDTEDKVSNDFFLLGNLISVLFGILYFLIISKLLST